jgi:hypothetical protein
MVGQYHGCILLPEDVLDPREDGRWAETQVAVQVEQSPRRDGTDRSEGSGHSGSWWLRLGIRLERIRPGRPQENGAHERFHRTLKAEATRPARTTAQLQQRAFDRFRLIYNRERPHEALGQKPPATVYQRADRSLPASLAPYEYPAHFERRRISRQGQLCWHSGLYFVSLTLYRQTVGLEPRGDGTWTVYFGPVAIGQLDKVEGVLKPYGHGIKVRRRAPKVLPMCPV